jgi:hypothetical protein
MNGYVPLRSLITYNPVMITNKYQWRINIGALVYLNHNFSIWLFDLHSLRARI